MIKKLNVSEIAARLDEPFSMADVAFVSDISVGVYICEGMVQWHRHVDIDELFWVHEGTILLESEWGDVQLQPGELAVVPKGVSHRSSAGVRAIVLLMRCGFAPHRKNGRRRLYVTAGEDKLESVSLRNAAQTLARPFRFHTVARFDGSILQTAWGVGTWPVGIPDPHDVFLFVLKGTATVRTSARMLHLHPGDFTVVPHDTLYQLSTTQGTSLARVVRQDPPSDKGQESK